MTATAPTIAYPSGGAPQGTVLGSVNLNPPIKWLTGNNIKWTTGNPIRWIKTVSTTPDLASAPVNSFPTIAYIGVADV